MIEVTQKMILAEQKAKELFNTIEQRGLIITGIFLLYQTLPNCRCYPPDRTGRDNY